MAIDPDATVPPRARHQMPGGRRRALVGTWLGVVLGLVVHLLTRRHDQGPSS